MQDSKKKILIVIHQLNYGGVQKSLLPALNAIDYTKNDVTLYVRKNRIQLLENINSKVDKVIINQDDTHYYRRPYMLYLMICEHLGKMFKRKKIEEKAHEKIVACINKQQMEYERKNYFNENIEYDVAIAYIQGYTAQFVAQYVSAKKKVMFYHGSKDDNHELHGKVISKFDRIVGINENVAQMLRDSYPIIANRVTHITNYVDDKPIKESLKENCVERKKKELILCSCGRISSEKGFDLAVEAAYILKKKGFSFLWYFVGDGAERIKIESLIENKGLTDNIRITGMLGNPYPYIAGCDVYIQPSYEESFGLTIAEAKILCKPIVSTKTIGGKLQIQHGNNGILTEISGQAIADGVLEYLQKPELRSKVISILENISYSEIYKEYQLKWEQLLGD